MKRDRGREGGREEEERGRRGSSKGERWREGEVRGQLVGERERESPNYDTIEQDTTILI